MRLVYLNGDPGIPWLGAKGASVHARAVAKALARRVAKLTVVTARVHPRRGPAAPAVFPYEVLEGGVPDAPGAAELGAFAGNDRVARLLEDLRERGDADGIYERHSLAGVAGAEAARNHVIPRVVEVNAPLVQEAARHRGLTLRSLSSFVERRLLIEASRVVVVSDPLAAHVRELGVDPSRIEVVPNGFDAGLFAEATSAGTSARETSAFTVMFVGSLKPWHGLDVLVAAFERLHRARPGSRLVVVGEGPLSAGLAERLGRSLPATSFELTGAVAHESIPALLQRADVAVAPYPALDSFYFSPLKVVEYAAAGRPIVASDIGQIRELLADGASALLVPPGDPGALSRALERLAGDRALRERLGRGARAAVRGRTWDDVADRVLALFGGIRTNAACEAAR